MSSVRGSTRNLREIGRELSELPLSAAIETAQAAAGEITGQAGATYDAGQNVYGGPRPLGVRGNPLSLKRSGAVRGDMRFVSDGGTKIRAVLGERYAKYLVGKYRILPIGASALPTAWLSGIDRIAREQLDRLWSRVAGGLR